MKGSLPDQGLTLLESGDLEAFEEWFYSLSRKNQGQFLYRLATCKDNNARVKASIKKLGLRDNVLADYEARL